MWRNCQPKSVTSNPNYTPSPPRPYEARFCGDHHYDYSALEITLSNGRVKSRSATACFPYYAKLLPIVLPVYQELGICSSSCISLSSRHSDACFLHSSSSQLASFSCLDAYTCHIKPIMAPIRRYGQAFDVVVNTTDITQIASTQT